jgi:hypothetical protein
MSETGTGGLSKYSQEEAGRLVKEWTLTRERLRKRLRGLESAIDLDTGVRQLEPRLKKRLAKLIKEGYEPTKVNDKYPEPKALLMLVAELKHKGENREAALLSRTIRDIRLLRVVAQKMSGRRERKEILTRADRRLEGLCWSCHTGIRKGDMVWWDRDRGVAWHEFCPPIQGEPSDGTLGDDAGPGAHPSTESSL